MTTKINLTVKLKDIGKRLERARKQLNRTPDELGKISDVTLSDIEEMEKGKKRPNQSYLFSLAQRYNVNINWVFTGKGQMFVSDIENDYNFGNDKRQMEEIIYMMEQSPYIRFKIIAHYWEMKAENKDIFDSVIEKIPITS